MFCSIFFQYQITSLIMALAEWIGTRDVFAFTIDPFLELHTHTLQSGFYQSKIEHELTFHRRTQSWVYAF